MRFTGHGTVLRFVIMLLAILAAMSLTTEAKPTSTCPATLNVIDTVYDYDTADTLLLVRSDDYNGSGRAEYSAALNADVGTYIYCGKWWLNLYSQSVRTLFITPNDAINGSQPAGPSAGYYWQNVEVAGGCYDQNGNLVYLQNILSLSNNCGMIVDFYSGGTKYKLSIGPGCSGCASVPAPQTGLMTVTCNQVSNNQCVSWTFAPNMASNSTNPPTVANLYYYGRAGRLVFVGQYYETFRIDVNP
jgi:hypothetical protein